MRTIYNLQNVFPSGEKLYQDWGAYERAAIFDTGEFDYILGRN